MHVLIDKKCINKYINLLLNSLINLFINQSINLLINGKLFIHTFLKKSEDSSLLSSLVAKQANIHETHVRLLINLVFFYSPMDEIVVWCNDKLQH